MTSSANFSLTARACALAVTLLCCVGATAADSNPLVLRMDSRLLATTIGNADETTAALTRFGMSDIRRRIQLYRDKSSAIAERSSALDTQIKEYEALIARLRGLNRVQDQTIGTVEQAISGARDAPTAARAASTAAPAVTPSRAQSAPVQPAASEPSARDAGGVQLAGVSLNRAMAQTVAAAVGVSALVALGLMWSRRRRPQPAIAAAPVAVGSLSEAEYFDAIADSDRTAPPAAPAPRVTSTRTSVAEREHSTAPAAAMAAAPAAAPEAAPAPPRPAAIPDVGGETDIELDRVLAAIHEVPSTPASPAPPAERADEADTTSAETAPEEEPTGVETPYTDTTTVVLNKDDIAEAVARNVAETPTLTLVDMDAPVTEARSEPSLESNESAGGDTVAEPASASRDTDTLPLGGDTSTWDIAESEPAGTDRDMLKEVDTLIAFEHYGAAKEILDTLLSKDPKNPEYVLRHYHVRTQGGVETHDGDEEMLRTIMDGPLSDTIVRVREIGRSLMPGDPLFKDDEQREAAREMLQNNAPPADEDSGLDATQDVDYSDTVVIAPPMRPKSSG